MIRIVQGRSLTQIIKERAVWLRVALATLYLIEYARRNSVSLYTTYLKL